MGSATSKMAEAALQAVLQRFAASQAPAVAIGMVGKPGILLTASAGTATEHTTFLTASISKTVVALLCMQCVERREVNLHQDINNYIAQQVPTGVRNPNFPEVPVTMQHLLTHSSGLSDSESALTQDNWRTKGADSPIPLHIYVNQRLCPSDTYDPSIWSVNASPGQAAWHYSNAGFATLGLVLESCTGRYLDALAQERLFEPLGMHHSTFSLDRALKFPDLVQPHSRRLDPDGSRTGPQPDPHYGVTEYPAAMLRSSAHDLCLYLSALIAPESSGILTAESVEMPMPTVVARDGSRVCAGGLGWWGMDAAFGDPTGQCFSHGGFM